MKKLMIIAAVAVAAMASQASNFSWKFKSGQYIKDGFNNDGVSEYSAANLGAGYVAYLFNADTYSQQDLLTAFNADGATAAGLAAKAMVNTADSKAVSANLSGGKYAATAFSANKTGSESAENTLSAYLAVFTVDGDGNLGFAQTKDGKNAIMISDIGTAVYSTQDAAQTLTIGTGATTYSQAAYSTASTFTSNGWYAAASAIPEPTSGLLLLLGVAGLALRRRRA